MLASRAPERARAWLADLDRVGSSEAGTAELGRLYASATRVLGKAAVSPSAEEVSGLTAAGVESRLDRWGTDDLGRVCLLMRLASAMPAAELGSVVAELYRTGEVRERAALLSALPFLPSSPALLELGIEACRVHIQPVFEAIACDNAYPSREFPEAAFNQMVLKCLFTGAPLDRVVGLQGRTTPELQRMVRGYVSERRAAGRTVPADAALVLVGEPV